MQTCPRDTAEELLRGATVVQKTTVQRATVTCGRDHLGAALQNKLSPEEPPNRVVNRRVPTGLKDLIPARYLALLLSPQSTLIFYQIVSQSEIRKTRLIIFCMKL